MTDKQVRQFVDTNILVYAHDITAGEKRDQAIQLIRRLWAGREGCVSIQVLQEFYVTITRKVHKPLSPSKASKIIESLNYWTVHEPKTEDILGAIDLQQRYQLSFWDAMILWSAGQLQCSALWSEDLALGQKYGDIILKSPFVVD